MLETEKLEAYLASHMPETPRCGEYSQIFGGASRDTYRLALLKPDGSPGIDVIIRLPQESGLLDTDQTMEYHAYQAYLPTDIPVPDVLAMDESGDVVGRPFIILELLPGEAGNPFAKDFYKAVAEPVGMQFWDILGRLGSHQSVVQALSEHFPGANVDTAWSAQLDHWLGVYAKKVLGPDPLFEAAVRWLKRNPPKPSGPLGVIHGDYRMGNFLVDGETISGILDWEMVHLGDPMEDVGWAMSYLWSRFTPDSPGGMIEADRALDIWSKSSGRDVDAHSVKWWRLFNCVKGMVIWNSAGFSIASGANPYPGYLNGAWLAADLHRAEMLKLMRQNA